MPPILRLKRDHAFHRAAQLLADAFRCREGLAPLPLVQMDPDERAFFKQAARNAIEVFELIAEKRSPDAEQAKAEAVAGDQARRLEEALANRLAIERSRARFIATERGHDLTMWAPSGSVEGEEQACCKRCTRDAHISIGADPVLSGSALTEGCLTSAPEGDPRR